MFHSAPISMQCFLAELPCSASLTVYLRRPQYVTLILILEYGRDFLLSPISLTNLSNLPTKTEPGRRQCWQSETASRCCRFRCTWLGGWALFYLSVVSFLWNFSYPGSSVPCLVIYMWITLWNTDINYHEGYLFSDIRYFH